MMKNIKERLNDPFLGIYVVSWIIFNWKFALVLTFGQADIVTRIKYLEDLYFANICQTTIAFAITFIVTLAWFFGYPYLRRFLISFYEKQIAYLKKNEIRYFTKS